MTDQAAPPTTDRPVIALRGIGKVFPGVIANADVDFDLRAGEIHALLGENGAGKSTLMNILTGIYRPDSGQILMDGAAKTFASPVEAIAAGIGMVHQHFKLVRAFSVAENVHLGWKDTPRLASKSVLEARTRALAERYGLAVRPEARIDELSAGEQQRVEILRVLARQARVLILDEPTAVLTPAEARTLFTALRAFKAAGNSVIFISHKLDEVLEISDRVTVLRGGRKVVTEPTANCTTTKLAQLMVGREMVLGGLREAMKPRTEPGRVVLALQKVSATDDRGRAGLIDADLPVRAGEILGIAGVAGNGQRELSEILTGIRKPTSGKVLIEGVPVDNPSPDIFIEVGVGHIPEDRIKSGIAPALSISDNAVLRAYAEPPIAQGVLFKPGAADKLAQQIADDAEVTIPSLSTPMRNLSGGNQQRLVARREMRIAKLAIIAAYPSRGLDVGAISTLLHYLIDLRNSGVAVVLISEELSELFDVTDRIAVMFKGRVMGLYETKDADLETIGLLMGGQTKATSASEAA
ncbi:ABC transporter ATP-binding protein [Kaistia dalseonensis]|uniref:Simple sugar transport system ATP-binding protein n=1 Tax=Kaistia dalseonensis TaxID=410840 RepID=A0ABU0HCJ7_9HYPH|nr:ABC transporter ATP-binding protein [Kaistia dalseonensis]MCX5497404.1 ABC transporter ATP-binding protein [Kaistia dalseonensis]MDQ0440043.1 simple sugar transport system ATP-binding protein [Kaistia dalseonensis]